MPKKSKLFAEARKFAFTKLAGYEVLFKQELVEKYYRDYSNEEAEYKANSVIQTVRKDLMKATGGTAYSIGDKKWVKPHGEYSPGIFARIYRKWAGTAKMAANTFDSGVKTGRIASNEFRIEGGEMPTPKQIEE